METTTSVNPEAAAAALAIAGGVMIFVLLFSIAIYVFMAICLMKIAKKTNTPNAWFAWIPILNVFLMVMCAKKSFWWILLLFIPIANIVAAIMIWMAIAKNLKKPEWLGILMIIPVANLIVPAYLAFSEDTVPAETSSTNFPPTSAPPTNFPPSGPGIGQF